MDLKPIGKAYGVTCDIAEKYYGKPLFYLPEMMVEMKDAGNREWVETEKAFPIPLYSKLTDIIVRYFWRGFPCIRKETIKPAILTAWKYHKKYLLQLFEPGGPPKDLMDVMVAEANHIVLDAPAQCIDRDFLTELCFQAADDVARRLEKMEQVMDMVEPETNTTETTEKAD